MGFFGCDKFGPFGAAKNIVAKREGVFKVVFFHDPRGAQTTPVEIVLGVVLFEKDFFEYFGKCVTTCVRAVFLLFGYGHRMWVNKVAHACITTNENELFEGVAFTAGFEQPKESFDGDVHDTVGGFFAGGQVQHVGDAVHCGVDIVLIGHVAACDFEAVLWVEHAVVTKSTHGGVLIFGII